MSRKHRAPSLLVTKHLRIAGIDSRFGSEACMIYLGVMVTAMALVTVLLPRSELFDR